MSKKIKQILAGIFLLAVLAVFAPVQMVAMAATGKITFSDPSTAVGQEVSVNMKISTADGSLGSADIMLSYDASALTFISGNSVEGGAGTLRAHGGPDASDLKTIVFTMKFRALRAGSSQIRITSQEVYDTNAQAVTISHEGVSTVTAASDGSTNGLLLALSLTPGTLSPEFSPSVDNYSAHVGMDVQQVEVEALAGEGSVVTVEGSDGLQTGENTITIRVTAPDGVTVKNYTVSVTKSEGGESMAVQPETVQGISLEAPAKAITILAPEEGVVLPEGFSATTINIDGYEAPGFIWASESNHQYCVFYAMNAAGEKNFYRYDLTEKTIQRYFQDPAIDTGVSREEYVKVAEDYNNLLQDYKTRMYIMIALAAVIAVLLVLVIFLLITRRSASRRLDDAEPEPHQEEDNRKKHRVMNEEERYLRGEEEHELTEPRNRVKAKTKEPMHYRRQEEEMEIMDLEEDNNFQDEEEQYYTNIDSSSDRSASQNRTQEDEDFEFLDLD